MRGFVTVRSHAAGTIERLRQVALETALGFNAAGIPRISDYAYAEICAGRVAVGHANLIVSSNNHGQNLILQKLAGEDTYTLHISHGDMGTGSTTPALSDTNLTTGVARAVLAAYSISNNIITLQFFFSDGVLPDGTYYEFGSFVDGSGTLGSGQLFNHAIFGVPYVKTSGVDTTVEVQLTTSSI